MSVVVALVVVMGVLLAVGTVLVLVLLDGSRRSARSSSGPGRAGRPDPSGPCAHHAPWVQREDGAGGA